jgi:photosynthetic reaction center cytochrome c subunit
MRLPAHLARASIAAALIGALTVSASAQTSNGPKNLKVLPANLSRDSVVKIMRYEFASGLGVSCSFCHGRPNIPFDSIDYASDERPTKLLAREMFRMMNRINTELLPAIPGRSAPPMQLQCITCHRGATRPLMLEDTLGTVLSALGPDSMVATYDRLRQRYSGRFAYDFGQRSLNTLAGRLIEQNRLTDARRVLELAIQEHPQMWDPAFALGQVYEALGEKQLAIEQYRRVLTFLPSHAATRRRLEALTGRAP